MQRRSIDARNADIAGENTEIHYFSCFSRTLTLHPFANFLALFPYSRMKVLILAGDGFEDIELFYPLYRLKEEKIDVVVASNKDVLTGKHGYSIKAIPIDDINVDGYDGLVIPGGKGPERLRFSPKSGKLVREFFEKEKPIAAICHGPQLLISAGVVKGMHLTSYRGIKDDLIAAGATWEDKEVIVDGNVVTSRVPPDLPAMMREFLRLLRS